MVKVLPTTCPKGLPLRERVCEEKRYIEDDVFTAKKFYSHEQELIVESSQHYTEQELSLMESLMSSSMQMDNEDVDDDVNDTDGNIDGGVE